MNKSKISWNLFIANEKTFELLYKVRCVEDRKWREKKTHLNFWSTEVKQRAIVW